MSVGRAGTAKDAAIERARAVLALDGSGRPCCGDAATVLAAIDAVAATGDAGAYAEVVGEGFLRGAAARYDDGLAGGMVAVPAGRFTMGTDEADLGHFYGESPRHEVELSPYLVAATQVTNAQFSLLDASRLDVPAAQRSMPVVGVTWPEAALFAVWTACRLLTEAEWERSCGAGSAGQWCCVDEQDLERYAWYCRNSGAELQPVATREPNALGLFDFHGNVWEWCQDDWDQDWYAVAPAVDPVAAVPPRRGRPADKVTRGGSYHALPEMCRTRYRMHEPAGFLAGDLGFRVARSAPGGT